MNFYDCLQLLNWKKLSDEEKETIFAGVLKFFVNPALSVDWQQLVTFEMCGMKCRTYELMLSGEKYVFIPGQKDVILGWDFGSEGLRSQEVGEWYDAAEGKGENVFKTSLTAAELTDLIDRERTVSESYDFSQLAEIDRYINDHTSPLRKVDIPPMLVAKHSQPVGTAIRGIYDSVTGKFNGDEQFWKEVESNITNVFQPTLTLAESLDWSPPTKVFQKDHFYLEQLKTNEDLYQLFAHYSLTYGELWLRIHRQGFQLLSEDAWEYAVGGGTRRLFRWGNELHLESHHPFHGIGEKVRLPNMFGIEIAGLSTKYEVTDNSECLKLDVLAQENAHLIEKVLPLSSYYQPKKQLALNKPLSPAYFNFRKCIIIEPE